MSEGSASGFQSRTQMRLACPRPRIAQYEDFCPMDTRQTPPSLAWYRDSLSPVARVSTIPQRGRARTGNPHLRPGMPFSAWPTGSNSQVQSLRQTHPHPLAGQVPGHPEIGGGFSGRWTPPNIFDHITTAPSLDSTHTRRPNWRTATPPQGPPPQNRDFPMSPSAAILPTQETPFATETCPFIECQGNFGRLQDLERHVLQHLPRCMYCMHCDWTGNRRYALRGHLDKHHCGAPLPERERYMIYDARVLVKQLLNREITEERAVYEARVSFRNKAAQLGTLGFWRE